MGVAVGVPLAIVVLVVVIAAFVVLCKKSADDRKHIEPMSPYYAGATLSMSCHFSHFDTMLLCFMIFAPRIAVCSRKFERKQSERKSRASSSETNADAVVGPTQQSH